jgi:hypothetical protein
MEDLAQACLLGHAIVPLMNLRIDATAVPCTNVFTAYIVAGKRRSARFYIQHMHDPIFPGSSVTVLAASYTFLTIKVEHAVSDIAFNLFMRGFAYGMGTEENYSPRCKLHRQGRRKGANA